MSTDPPDPPEEDSLLDDEPLPSHLPRRGRAIGSILVRLQRLSANDVERIRTHADANGLKFGDAAIELNLLTQQDIDVALGQQFYFPVLGGGDGAQVSTELVAAHRPQSEAAESLRSLRSRLHLTWQRGNPRRLLAIVSPDRGDGRSWLAANLALAFAHVGDRVLLIDADFRSPRQHELFNLRGSAGLSELLTGRADRSAVHRVHPQLRLFVLPAGEIPPNPQELLTRPFFEMFLNRLADQFDIVIIDTPPASECSDAQVLASRAGFCITLSRLGHTQQSHLRAMVDGFQQTGTNIVGGVLNDFQPPEQPGRRFRWRP